MSDTARRMLRLARASAMMFAVLLAPAGAQPAPMPGHAAMDHDMKGGEMAQAMQRMNADMTNAPMTGDPDRDFTAMMIPHHQGAIDMARLYLRDGRDPAMRRMAQKIVVDQQREIREMKDWQAKHR